MHRPPAEKSSCEEHVHVLNTWNLGESKLERMFVDVYTVTITRIIMVLVKEDCRSQVSSIMTSKPQIIFRTYRDILYKVCG